MLDIFKTEILSLIVPTILGWFSTSLLAVIFGILVFISPSIFLFLTEGWETMKLTWGKTLLATIFPILFWGIFFVVFSWGYNFKNYQIEQAKPAVTPTSSAATPTSELQETNPLKHSIMELKKLINKGCYLLKVCGNEDGSYKPYQFQTLSNDWDQ